MADTLSVEEIVFLKKYLSREYEYDIALRLDVDYQAVLADVLKRHGVDWPATLSHIVSNPPLTENPLWRIEGEDIKLITGENISPGYCVARDMENHLHGYALPIPKWHLYKDGVELEVISLVKPLLAVARQWRLDGHEVCSDHQCLCQMPVN